MRGLKFFKGGVGSSDKASHLAWGAWIEMYSVHDKSYLQASHLAWGAWIEIIILSILSSCFSVAPRMGCVD